MNDIKACFGLSSPCSSAFLWLKSFILNNIKVISPLIIFLSIIRLRTALYITNTYLMTMKGIGHAFISYVIMYKQVPKTSTLSSTPKY